MLSAFHESPELLSAEHYPQAGFPAAPYADDPAQTFFLRGISLPAAHTHVAPAPAAWALVRSAAALLLAECVHRPCAGAAYFLSMAQMVNPDTPTAVPTWLTRHPLQLAGHRRVALGPAALVSVRSAAAAILAVCEEPLHVDAAGRTAPAARPQKNLLIFCG